jgi:hypothetical protein
VIPLKRSRFLSAATRHQAQNDVRVQPRFPRLPHQRPSLLDSQRLRWPTRRARWHAHQRRDVAPDEIVGLGQVDRATESLQSDLESPGGSVGRELYQWRPDLRCRQGPQLRRADQGEERL